MMEDEVFLEDVEDDSLGHAGLAVLPVDLHGHGLGVSLADRALPVHSLSQHHSQLPGVVPTTMRTIIVIIDVMIDHAHADWRLLVHVRVVHKLSVSLAVGRVQGAVLHQEVDQSRRRGAQQVPAGN